MSVFDCFVFFGFIFVFSCFVRNIYVQIHNKCCDPVFQGSFEVF